MILSAKLANGLYSFDTARPLGSPGGCGEVFEGKDAAGNLVAVKRLFIDAADAHERELTIADYLKGRGLRHVMPVIDSGKDAGSDNIYVVMPKASHDLSHEVKTNGPIKDVECARILLQVATGLSEIEELVHRDLKPGNVLLHEGSWKVADFGIARFVDIATGPKTKKKWQSDEYAAPERWRGETAKHPTDIYALGCIGFYLLSGLPPFTEELEESHLNRVPPDAPCADGRLRGIIGHMLRKAAADRPLLARIIAVLNSIVSSPAQGPGLKAFAEAGARVSAHEGTVNAAREARRLAEKLRIDRYSRALNDLIDIEKRLAERMSNENSAVHANALNLENCIAEIHFGNARMTIRGHMGTNLLKEGEFPNSKWDVIAHGEVFLEQAHPAMSWSSSLWFGKLDLGPEFRWYEVAYCSRNERDSTRCGPRKAKSFQEADIARIRSTIECSVAYIYPIDGEDEDNFQRRMMSLMALGSEGKLKRLDQVPFAVWPFPID
jgi:serine/threonine-protein kinase